MYVAASSRRHTRAPRPGASQLRAARWVNVRPSYGRDGGGSRPGSAKAGGAVRPSSAGPRRSGTRSSGSYNQTQMLRIGAAAPSQKPLNTFVGVKTLNASGRGAGSSSSSYGHAGGSGSLKGHSSKGGRQPK